MRFLTPSQSTEELYDTSTKEQRSRMDRIREEIGISYRNFFPLVSLIIDKEILNITQLNALDRTRARTIIDYMMEHKSELINKYKGDRWNR